MKGGTLLKFQENVIEDNGKREKTQEAKSSDGACPVRLTQPSLTTATQKFVYLATAGTVKLRTA